MRNMLSDMNALFIRNLYYKYIKSNRYPIYEKNRLDKKIESLKDKYYGQACFIVGNGPSLRVEDLENIKDKGIPSIGANSVYKLFDKTNWRPTYYVFQDQQMIDGLAKYFPNFINKCEGIVVRRDAYRQIDSSIIKNEKLFLPRLVMKIRKDNFFDFSSDIAKCAYDGCTVTYLMIQLAYYMGFKKIFLIGIDHNFPKEFDREGNIITTKKEKFHAFEDNKDIILNPGRVIESTYAYQSANEFLTKAGVEIYNSTRGGKLEVFPRKDLDVLMGEL